MCASKCVCGFPQFHQLSPNTSDIGVQAGGGGGGGEGGAAAIFSEMLKVGTNK